MWINTVFICVREKQRIFANEVRPKLATVHHDTAKWGIWVELTLKLHTSVTSIVPPLITLPCKNQHWLKTHTPMHLQNPGFLPHSHIDWGLASPSATGVPCRNVCLPSPPLRKRIHTIRSHSFLVAWSLVHCKELQNFGGNCFAGAPPQVRQLWWCWWRLWWCRCCRRGGGGVVVVVMVSRW